MKTTALIFSLASLLLATALPVVSSAQVTSGQIYRLVTTCGSGQKVLGISSDGIVDGVAAVLTSPDPSKESQFFKIEIAGSGYKFTALHS